MADTESLSPSIIHAPPKPRERSNTQVFESLAPSVVHHHHEQEVEAFEKRLPFYLHSDLNDSQRAIILLGIALVFGFVGMVLVVSAYASASYYMSVCLSENTNAKQFALIKNEYEIFNCKEQTALTYDNCVANDKYDKRSRDLGKSYAKRECPEVWLVEPFAFILPMCWLATLGATVGIVILRRRNLMIVLLVGIFTVILGAVFFLAAVCLVVFYMRLLSSTEWCTTTVLQMHRVEPEVNEAAGSPVKEKTLKDVGFHNDNCDEFNDHVFQPWLILTGAALSAFAGLCYILAGAAEIHSTKQTPAVAPAPLLQPVEINVEDGQQRPPRSMENDDRPSISMSMA